MHTVADVCGGIYLTMKQKPKKEHKITSNPIYTIQQW